MSIPNEIYALIFRYVNRCDLPACFTACKDWSPIALQVFYHELHLSEFNITRLKSHFGQHLSFQHCHLVRKLTLSVTLHPYYWGHTGGSINDLTKEEFLKLVAYLPKLKEIKLCINQYAKVYLQHLLELDSDQYLTRLEKISDESDESLEEYPSVYFKFRASLKHISLDNAHESLIDTQYGGILTYLSCFKNLVHLTYSSNSEKHISIYQLQVACPHLTNLNLHYYNDPPELQDISNGFYSPNNLKKLSLNFPSLSVDYIELITKHLPATVSNLHIGIDGTDLYEWINLVGLENVLKLVEQMNRLSVAKIIFTSSSEYNVDYKDSNETLMTIFFKILRVYKGDRNVFCTANFSTLPSFHHSISLSDKKMDFFYGLKNSDMYGDDESERQLLNIAVPDKSVSIIGPEIINNLELNFFCKNVESSSSFLKYALFNCPYLQTVIFRAIGFNTHSFKLCTDTDCFYKPPERFDLIKASRNNLKVLRASCFIPSKEFLDLLALYLPNIHFIKCSKSMEEYTGERITHDLTMDLTKFETLDTFYFDIGLFLAGSESTACFIKCIFTNGEEFYYQFICKNGVNFNPVTLDFLQNNSNSSIYTIIFKCKKIRKFTIMDENTNYLLEINHNSSPKIRPIDIIIDDIFY